MDELEVRLRETLRDGRHALPGWPDATGRISAGMARRRRNRVLAVTGAAVLAAAVSVSVAGYAIAGHRHPVTPATPAPTASTSTFPSASASAAPAAPDGRIGVDELISSVIDLPPWPADWQPGCPSGKISMTGQKTGMFLLVRKAEYVDLDADGSQETIAIIGCYVASIGDGGNEQAVAFDRDATGAIRTMGQLIATRTGGVEALFDLRPGSNGAIEVQVGDLKPLGEWPSEVSQRQWRGYTWDGRRFTQTDGPTTFPPNRSVANLTVTADDLSFGAATDGSRYATVPVTVRNNGPYTQPAFSVTLRYPLGVHVQKPADLHCTLNEDGVSPGNLFCDGLAMPPAGKAVTLTFVFVTPASFTAANLVNLGGLDTPAVVFVDATANNGQGLPRAPGYHGQVGLQVTVTG